MITLLGGIGRHAVKFLIVTLLGLPAAVSISDAMSSAPPDPKLTPLAPAPGSLEELLGTPPKLTAWVDDHFGWRKDFIFYGNQLRFHVVGEFPTIQMVTGQHGRYFLGAHGTNVAPYQALTTVCGAGRPAPTTIPYLNKLFAAFHAAGMKPKLLVVPSAPVVHGEDVPAPLVADCSSDSTPVTMALNAPALAPEARANILFPLRDMRAIKKSATMFPDTWFHWTGPGLDKVARLSLEHFWPRPLDQAPPLQTRTYVSPSDVSHLFDGITLQSRIVEPDLPASGIEACVGVTCYPEVAEAARALNDVSRYRNPKAPARRLLIVSDSFGIKIAPWFARYYGRVEHVATNWSNKLAPEQIAPLQRFLYRDPANTDILFLYHDGGVISDVLRNQTERLLPVAPSKQG